MSLFSSFSLSLLLPLGIAALAGSIVPFQAASNVVLGRALGHPLWATLVSLLVSICVLLPVLFAARIPAPTIGPALQGPWWIWLGGVAGVAYITAALLLTPKLGASGFIVCVIAGQVVASLIIDHFGLMGLVVKPATLGRIAGVALIVMGMLLVQYSAASQPLTKSAVEAPKLPQ
ncbi:DMT family transporter [Pectobacterium sp. CFBP8739]|uniref:DMT family transporter n=1 Tax=Pectobacterium sp. CFBP8739 TaxID=2748908 RepID=UPI0015DE242C|nr:DMT family transporter [Pectobacterium sp. CFBP8739]MBA0166702.1 DMT family transporter [Pectobacterium sp. CFBP8739]